MVQFKFYLWVWSNFNISYIPGRCFRNKGPEVLMFHYFSGINTSVNHTLFSSPFWVLSELLHYFFEDSWLKWIKQWGFYLLHGYPVAPSGHSGSSWSIARWPCGHGRAWIARCCGVWTASFFVQGRDTKTCSGNGNGENMRRTCWAIQVTQVLSTSWTNARVGMVCWFRYWLTHQS